MSACERVCCCVEGVPPPVCVGHSGLVSHRDHVRAFSWRRAERRHSHSSLGATLPDREALLMVMSLGCYANLASRTMEQRGNKSRFQNIPTRRRNAIFLDRIPRIRNAPSVDVGAGGHPPHVHGSYEPLLLLLLLESQWWAEKTASFRHPQHMSSCCCSQS